MAYDGPIFPFYGSGSTTATSATPATVTLPVGAKQVCLTVTGTFPVYFRITDSTDTSVASAADALVNNVNRMVVSKNPDQTRMSVVSPGGASSVHVIGCDGSSTM